MMIVIQMFAQVIYAMEIQMMEIYVKMVMIARILFAHRIDAEHKLLNQEMTLKTKQAKMAKNAIQTAIVILDFAYQEVKQDIVMEIKLMEHNAISMKTAKA